jgi:hypothetical protein
MTTAAGVLSAQAAIVWTMKPDYFTIVLLIFLLHYYAAKRWAAVLCLVTRQREHKGQT